MRRFYLLSFVRNCLDLPNEPALATEITTFGSHGIVWCKPPREIFRTKNEFLMAMLQWFEEVQRLQLAVLPIQSGVSVAHEAQLTGILRTYKQELDNCFDKVEGCSEYYLSIKRNQEFASAAYFSLPNNVQSGKEYLERIRAKHQTLEKEVLQIREVISKFRLHLSPWLRDFWSDIQSNRGDGLNLSFLVPNGLQQEFCCELQSLLEEFNCPDKWTGPWPPFHFSTFALKPESFLRHESLNWGWEVTS